MLNAFHLLTFFKHHICKLLGFHRRYEQEFINQAPVAIAMLDRHMNYLAVSRRWLADFNLSSYQVIGRSHYEVFPEIPERWREVHVRCLAGQTERCHEDLFIREDGSQQWITWEVRPWYSDAAPGRIGGLIIFSEDVTALKRARDEEYALRARHEAEAASRREAERLNLLKDEFLTTLSHELRAPLHGLLGWVAILKRSGNRSPQLSTAISAIQESSSMMASLVSDIPDMNRVTAGKLRLEQRAVAVTPLIVDAIMAVLPEVQAKGITLNQELHTAAAEVNGDPVRIKQCITNILTNAIKFTPENGRIDVSAHIVSSVVQITVRDNGEGIPPPMLSRIFDRFTQVRPSNGENHGGLGLGLSIVKHIVTAHGGRVWAHSAGPGRGSEFTIELPRCGEGVAASNADDSVINLEQVVCNAS